ncbi:uncharacterized protein DUF1772 [Nonlabens dokdonensis]|jgi:hypothetical protein|uniref:DUF4149 domain-containing protein n=2 Tax=Nonlabens dokdonensis TaxID=328515 RepID=L7WDK9_NONDD|nr:DUF1772 domain-containing protein [Nonlabens dokdonensis]AGC78312.1 hypothetical protein DDD_3185 [Nonlabens dokdonensis DSW-6]PZX37800.1 uncharacterized protein DUF1772 [Nonlabens dokdonensis]
MSNLPLIQLLIDFGLIVLIWMVQLIIYPSFLRYESHSLGKWHLTYTGRITVIVAPLMIAQIALASYLLINTASYHYLEIIALGLIILNWLLTFSIFIPFHEKIDKDPTDRKVQRRLVQSNWMRVVLFCLTFICHVFYYLLV